MIRQIGDGIHMKNGYWGWYPLDILVSIFHASSCSIIIIPMKNGYWGIRHVQDPPCSDPYGPYVNSETLTMANT